ncbi:MAG TPA: hypothetical protein VE591_14345, partial [Candidatus Acidoferrum sp.]|nr:hypothetical protein [Candidatus Acidoferrum sp.]
MRTADDTAAPIRPERVETTIAANEFGIVQRPLSTWETIANNTALRKALILVVLAAVWELYGRKLNNPLLLPTFSATVQTLIAGILSGALIVKVLTS